MGGDSVFDLQCDLLDMPAVKQLGRDSKYAPVYRLLEIFLTGRLSDYLEFQAADASTLKNYGMHLMITNSLRFKVPILSIHISLNGTHGLIRSSICMQGLCTRNALLRCGLCH